MNQSPLRDVRDPSQWPWLSAGQLDAFHVYADRRRILDATLARVDPSAVLAALVDIGRVRTVDRSGCPDSVHGTRSALQREITVRRDLEIVAGAPGPWRPQRSTEYMAKIRRRAAREIDGATAP